LRIFDDLSISLGAFLVSSILLKTFGPPASTFIYYLIMTILVFMTFQKERVRIIYPIAFLIIFLSGHILGTMFLASFN
jgi:hypothetical protein